LTENKLKSNSPKAEPPKNTITDLEVDLVTETEEATEEEMIVTTDSEVEMTEDHEEILVVIDQKVVSIVVKTVTSPETAHNVIILILFSEKTQRIQWGKR
jgi:hypothetical protein